MHVRQKNIIIIQPLATTIYPLGKCQAARSEFQWIFLCPETPLRSPGAFILSGNCFPPLLVLFGGYRDEKRKPQPMTRRHRLEIRALFQQDDASQPVLLSARQTRADSDGSILPTTGSSSVEEVAERNDAGACARVQRTVIPRSSCGPSFLRLAEGYSSRNLSPGEGDRIALLNCPQQPWICAQGWHCLPPPPPALRLDPAGPTEMQLCPT
ncbi:hypothetical protein BC827DRAFT_726805 [Russula dissimulans]|nr:hypothetical protein BC827DRAFT_726805 [Russula dissimulans]